MQQPETPASRHRAPASPESLKMRHRSANSQAVARDAGWETWVIATLTSFTAGFVIAVLWWGRKGR
jgi:hypothetical protein